VGGGVRGVAEARNDQQRHCGQCNITEKVRMSLNSIEVNNDLVALTSVATIRAVSRDFPSSRFLSCTTCTVIFI
jgi:DNA-directed RNA polymerase subunit M/transcription elongation factor TFIIS